MQQILTHLELHVCFHNNSFGFLDFNVYSLQNACGLCISIVPSKGSHLQLWVRWQTYSRYFRIRCATTPRQCLNFRLWSSFM